MATVLVRKCLGQTRKKFFKKSKHKCLVPSNPELSHTPQTDREWCNEALASHDTTPLNGIIVSAPIERTYRKKSRVSSVNKLLSPNVEWWSPADSSLRLNRTIQDYKDALKLILRHAKSIMFIDPYIYPAQSNYADFVQLLEAAGNRPPQSPRPLIEIHSKIRNIPKKNKEETLRSCFKTMTLYLSYTNRMN